MPVTLDALRPATSELAGDWADLLAEIATDTQVGVDGFRIGAQVAEVAPQRGHGFHQTLVARLTHALYERYYHHHDTPHLQSAVETPDKRPASAREDAAFGRRLRTALGERHYWEDGWRIAGSSDDGRTIVERDDLVLHVADDELERTDDDGARVRFPADRPWASTGFFVVTGTSGPMTRATGLVRCYLHLLPDTAPEVFAQVVAGLDELGLRFSAKVLNDPAAFGRPDSAVVYVAREHLRAALRVVLAVRGGAPSFLAGSVPAFTRRVRPGIAVADDPGPGASFGQHRCCAVAAGVVAAGPAAGPTERLAAIHRSLLAEGLDPGALHLDPGQAEFDLAGL